jgi:allantoate deiminase
MGFRRDALAAAAEMIVGVERLGASHAGLVATVGRIDARPGAPNVIPGRVEFSIDMRSPSDAVRHRAQRELLALLRDIAVRRRVELETRIYQEVPATALDPRITAAVRKAIAACGMDVVELSSGAGHDAMMMAKLCPSGMIFLRCKDGISHNPAESITVEDADAGVRVLLETVRRVDTSLEGRS